MRVVFRTKTIIVALSLLLTGCAKLVPSPGEKKSDPVYSIAVQSGDGQTGNINGTLPYALVALVKDKSTGLIASNVEVRWDVASGGGHLSTQYTRTSPLGEAPASLVLGSSVGTNTVTATVSTGDSITFTAHGAIGVPSSGNCLIVGSSPVEPDGTNFSTITITLKDSSNNPVAGTTPTFSATGSTNGYGGCSATNASGVSTCQLTSTTAETKILSLTSPVSKVGGAVVFAPGAVSSANSTITGTGTVVANGTATSTITITLKDSLNVAVAGIVPHFSATDTGATNAYGTCSSTNTSGVSTCTLTSTHAETKTLAITSPVSKTGGTVVFVPGPPALAHTTIVGTSPIENDGISTSTITVTLQDANSNPIPSVVPTFSATNTGSTNGYTACSSTNSLGQSVCALSSTTPETKVLSMLSPLSFAGGSVVFAPGNVVAANSSITGSGPVIADGVLTSTITITLRDASNVPVSGRTPTFSATDTSSKNVSSACSMSNTLGVSTCTLASTYAETKTLTLTSPVNKTGGTVVFNPGTPSAVTSTITGTTNVTADGATQSTITITIRDANTNPIPGITPAFSATDTGTTNTYLACTTTSAAGVSTCKMTSTKAEIKALTVTSPVTVSSGTITFIHGTASAPNSSITGSGPVPPDGTSTSTITVTLRDAFNNPVNATVPTFSASDTGGNNVYGACSSSSTLGASTCTLKSSTAETKTLAITSPVSLSGGTVVFAAGGASALHSTITGTGPFTADGAANSTVTITLKDSSNLAIVGTVPTFTATNTGNGNAYGTCSATNGSGVSTCSLTSTKAETKTLSIASPINLSGGTVTFTAGVAAATASQITGTSSTTADGTDTSTVTIVLYDVHSNPVAGTVPAFSATDTGGTNIYGTCSSTDATGASTCTLASTKAETKTLSITTPVSKSGANVSFVAGTPSASNSTITATGPTNADETDTSVVTITLKDVMGNPVGGVVPTFAATDSGSTNSYGACTTSSGSGISTCLLTSGYVETKTLSIVTPVAVSGGTAVFTQAASPTNSNITGTSNINANGTATSTVTITLKDYSNNAIVGVVPTFTASGTQNVYAACSATSAAGVSTCTLKSTMAETKTLSIASPIIDAGGSVVFKQVASPTYSTIVADASAVKNVNANVTITIKDYANIGMSGLTPAFTASGGTGNTVGGCSVTDSSGEATCTFRSSSTGTKTLKISSPTGLTTDTTTISITN